MNGLFWLVQGNGDGSGDGYGYGGGFGDGDGYGHGYGNGNGTDFGDGDSNGAESDFHTQRILAVPRTLEAHAVVAAVLGRLP